MTERFTHFDELGNSRMVDVGDKPVTDRFAVARGTVRMRPETLQKIKNVELSKGDVLQVARLAGIMAAKQTDRLIPLCHQIPLDCIEIGFDFPSDTVLSIAATVRCVGRTGVEMEALTAVSVAALTVYDMCKSVDREMCIEQTLLMEKSGGRSGHFRRDSKDDE